MAINSGKEYVGEMACPNGHCESHNMDKRVDVTLNDRGTLGTYCQICRKGDYAGVMHVVTRSGWIAEMRANGTFIGDRVLRGKIDRDDFDPANDPDLMQQVLVKSSEKEPVTAPAVKQKQSGGLIPGF